jgi:hypothetical protein
MTARREMSLDGSGHAARMRRARLLAVSFVAAATAAVLGWAGLDQWRKDQAEARYWTAQGPPCPELSPAAFRAQGDYPAQLTEVGGVRFARQAGVISCQAREGLTGVLSEPVCQFTHPVRLAVRTGAGEFYFAPGAGHPATVFAHGGKPSCVMAANVRDD